MNPNRSDDNSKRRHSSARAYQRWGWYIFILSAGFYIVASLRNGDWLSLLGSVCFLGACVLFLVPLLRDQSDDEPPRSR
jgi:hypothetical protein